jgi:heme-degrading monooxygenase HmoA
MEPIPGLGAYSHVCDTATRANLPRLTRAMAAGWDGKEPEHSEPFEVVEVEVGVMALTEAGIARESTQSPTTGGEAPMTTVLCRCRVADYDAWRAGYDHALKMTPGIRSFRVWRGQDDTNLVVIEETFDSREEALAAWTSAETQTAMEADGIDMSSVSIDYFDEIDSGTL